MQTEQLLLLEAMPQLSVTDKKYVRDIKKGIKSKILNYEKELLETIQYIIFCHSFFSFLQKRN